MNNDEHTPKQTALFSEKLSRMERQDLIRKIYHILKNDDKFRHSLGLSWLERMTDKELQDKLKEVTK